MTPTRSTTPTPSTVEVDTPEGPGRWHLDRAAEPRALLLLGHGAGGGVTAADLALLAGRLPGAGVSVGRFEQPWRLAARRVAVPPPRLDVGWRAAVGWLRRQPWARRAPLLVGGRSAGARVACRTADELGAVAVLCLAFPLHLPGRPERSRLAELLAPSVPRLVFQGTRDTFGTAAEVAAGLAGSPGGDGVVVVPLAGADHGFRLPARADVRPADLRARILAGTLELVASVTPGGPAAPRE